MRDETKVLLVEGSDDCFAIAELMGAYTKWDKGREPVDIKPCNNDKNILKKGYIVTNLKSNNLKILGVIIDADNDHAGKWSKMRTEFLSYGFSDVPINCPSSGLLLTHIDGKKAGAWIMPDNMSSGMIETFMRFLIPSQHEILWKHAEDSVNLALNKGANIRLSHTEKANIYTWLSWQDPPGQSLGRAITKNILNAKSPHALPFVVWFSKLFDLELDIKDVSQ